MSSDSEPIVTLKNGLKIHGCRMTTLKNQQLLAFKGIPYAEPPTGHLRFKPPVPKIWNTTDFDANKEIECIQIDMMSGSLIGQEDCLVLNIFTQKSTGKSPVIVHIHGGAYNGGSGIMCGPKKLLDQDIVLVTINYRLHAFGFLSTADDVAPGNYGLLDQIEALRWVQDNIELFGGDPNCVTAMGQSAGAGSLTHLILSPLAKDLFHRAIVMSGNAFCPWAIKSNPNYWAIKTAHAAGCTSSDSVEVINYLRNIPADVLTAIVANLWKEVMIPMNPIVDGYVLPDHPKKLLEDGLIVNNVPILIGVTKDETISLLPHFLKVINSLSINLGSPESFFLMTAIPLIVHPKLVTKETVELVKNRYFKSIEPNDDVAFYKTMVKAFSDALFIAPHNHFVNTLLDAGIKPYVYEFDYEGEFSIANTRGIKIIKGAGHGDDLYFLFDCAKEFPLHYQIPNNNTEDTFLQIWTNFVRHGIPSYSAPSDNINWKPSIPGNIQIYHLNDAITVETADSEEWNSKVEFWFKQIPATIIPH